MQTYEMCKSKIFETANAVFNNKETLKDYLLFISRNYILSWENQLLVFAQFPTASAIAGSKAWLVEGYHLKENSKPIAIFFPYWETLDEGILKTDADGNILVDKFRSVVYEKDPEFNLSFKVVPAYDISQTDKKTISVERQPLEYEHILNSILSNDFVSVKEIPSENFKDAYFIYNNGYWDDEEETIYLLKTASINQKRESLLKSYIRFIVERDFPLLNIDVICDLIFFCICSYINVDCITINYDTLIDFFAAIEVEERIEYLKYLRFTLRKLVMVLHQQEFDLFETALVNFSIYNDNIYSLSGFLLQLENSIVLNSSGNTFDFQKDFDFIRDRIVCMNSDKFKEIADAKLTNYLFTYPPYQCESDLKSIAFLEENMAPFT